MRDVDVACTSILVVNLQSYYVGTAEWNDLLIYSCTQTLNSASSIHSNLKCSLTQETDANVSLLDRLVHRKMQGFWNRYLQKTNVRPYGDSFHHPQKQKKAAIRCLLNRMHLLPLTPRNKQKAWTAILHIAKTNRFPLSLLTKLNTAILHKISSRWL